VVPASIVTLFAVVGAGDVAQQTPLARMVVPPSDVTLPPLIADAGVIAEIAAVVRVGTTGARVVKLNSGPYENTPNVVSA
jgi:hypothetical protein